MLAPTVRYRYNTEFSDRLNGGARREKSVPTTRVVYYDTGTPPLRCATKKIKIYKLDYTLDGSTFFAFSERVVFAEYRKKKKILLRRNAIYE